MGKGIDYGCGQTNIDKATGIRFGVIHQGEVLQSWCDAAEANYGDPHCPKCGNEAVDAENDDCDRGEYERKRGACGDYACDDCAYLFDGEDAFGEEPVGYSLDDGEYACVQNGDDCDIFVIRSPYFTRAAFCSPCAPGACSLADPDDDGERAYCFGHDWFDDGKAPYPVYSVATGELVEPE